MPNVGRYCTYRQSLDYLASIVETMAEADRRRVFRDNALGLFAAAGKTAT
jgi:hypothetical protein